MIDHFQQGPPARTGFPPGLFIRYVLEEMFEDIAIDTQMRDYLLMIHFYPHV
jgi:hypothetical protein